MYRPNPPKIASAKSFGHLDGAAGDPTPDDSLSITLSHPTPKRFRSATVQGQDCNLNTGTTQLSESSDLRCKRFVPSSSTSQSRPARRERSYTHPRCRRKLVFSECTYPTSTTLENQSIFDLQATLYKKQQELYNFDFENDTPLTGDFNWEKEPVPHNAPAQDSLSGCSDSWKT